MPAARYKLMCLGPANVAKDRIVDEVPEVFLGVTEVARDVHVVIDRERLGAPPDRCREIGGLADLRSETEIFGVFRAKIADDCHRICPLLFAAPICRAGAGIYRKSAFDKIANRSENRDANGPNGLKF
jgi:hypothetical protein